MFKYRNKATGVEFVTACECSGELWELVEAPTARKEAKEAEPETKEKKGRKK